MKYLYTICFFFNMQRKQARILGLSRTHKKLLLVAISHLHVMHAHLGGEWAFSWSPRKLH